MDQAEQLESVIGEMRSRWQSGDKARLEAYVERHPALGTDDNFLLRLVLAEYQLRLDSGERPDLADYIRRFPQIAERLRERSESEAADRPSAPSGCEADSTLIAGEPTAGATTVSLDPRAAVLPPGSQRTAARLAPLGTFGGYELLEVIARGGMGVVYKARQIKANRTVALKMILAGQLAGPNDVKRFETEASAAATLEHPNIVSVFEVGEHDGRHFYSMGLVDGQSLSDLLRTGPLAPKEAVRLMRQVAQALAYAHSKGIIHRDLKPQNILLSRDGSPRVADFGLAKQLSGNAELTTTGQVLGTPNFMSPEQARGAVHDVGPLSDVYSLGAVLYCLLTGRPPFQAADIIETLRQVATQEAVSPRLINPAVDRDLETITLKCLEKEPSKRYRSAADLVDDLDRFLDRKPILARPVSRAERAWRWCRRNPLAASLWAAVVLLLFVSSIGGPTLTLIANRNARQASENARRADQNADAERQAKDQALAREAETKAVLRFVEDRIITAALPEGQLTGLGNDITLRKALESALPFLDKSFPNEPLIEARLRLTIGRSLEILGDARTALKQQTAAYALYVRYRGPNDPETLKSMYYLANCYYSLARYTEALKLQEETLRLCKSTLGPRDPDTLANMQNLADTYYHLGRSADYLKLSEEAFALRQAVLGRDHPDTLQSITGVALGYNSLGRDEESLKLYREALALQQLRLGPEHPDTIHTMRALGSLYLKLGRYADAEKLLKESLRLNEKKLGRDHPETLMGLSVLAQCDEFLGRYDEVLALNQRALEVRKAKFGLENPRTLESMSQVAKTLAVLHRGPEAVSVIRETASIWEKRGQTDPSALYGAACIRAIAASVLQTTNDPAGARQEGDRAMRWLTQAIAGGFKDVALVKRDTDLDALHNREDFKKLVATLEATMAKSKTATQSGGR